MPLERRSTFGAYRPPTSPAGQLYGSFRTPTPTVAQTEGLRSTPNQRQAAPLERLDFAFTEYAPSILRAPALIAERPVAAIDALAGGTPQKPGPIQSVLKGIGDFGSGGSGPGPIGSFFKAVGDGIVATDTAAIAWANSGYAEQLAKYGHLGDNAQTDFGTGGWLFGLGDRRMTVGEVKAELDKRGWRNTAEGTLSWEELTAKARENRFAFGDRALTSSVATSTLASMLISPTNALFFIPGAGWAKAGSVAGKGLSLAGQSRWAKPVVTATSQYLGGARYGFGYFKDPAIAALRSPQVVNTAAAARELLAGSTKYASTRALLFAADTVMRGGKIAGKALKTFSGYRAPVKPTAWGYSKAAGGAYYRGALRLQASTLGAEFAAGRAVQDAEGTIFEGLTNTIYTALQNVNHARPLSDNETFMLFALTTMPAIPLVAEHVAMPGKAIGRAIGDNDAVLIAKEMGIKVDELYEKAGNGDIGRGKAVIDWALRQTEHAVAYREMGLTTRALGSIDAIVNRNQVLNTLVGNKVKRLREAGQLRATTRVQKFFDVPRKGEIVREAPRQFTWNASDDAILTSWSRFYDAWEALAPRAQKLGITTLTTSRIVTKEMLQDALEVILKDAPEAGIMPGWVRDEIIMAMPGLLDNAKDYGDFWQRVAVHSEHKPISGRHFTQEAQPDTRVRMEEVRAELEKLAEAAPSANELFHEAGVLEQNLKGGETYDRLQGSRLRKIYSPRQVQQLRDDASADIRIIRTEEKALSHIRNTEFTRNGTPKSASVDMTVGYRGGVYKRVDTTGMVNDNGTPVVDMFMNEDGHSFSFDPDDPLTVRIGMIDDTPMTSEVIVKAVQLGGRVIETQTFDRLEGTVLARHGFVEVAHIPAVLDSAGNVIEERRGFFAYVGGNPASLTDNLVRYSGPTRQIEVFDVDAGRMVGHATVPNVPEYIPIDLLVPFREIDREVVPKSKHDPNYLDELTLQIEATRLSGVDIQPVTITFDMFSNRALLEDGNHRLAAYLRLREKYRGTPNEGVFEDIPVMVDVGVKTLRNESKARSAHVSGEIITAQEIVGLVRSNFSRYKESKRTVKRPQAGRNLASKKAEQASLLVPATEAIGPSPTNGKGLFHGSHAEFDAFSNDFLSPSSLVGRGVYTTDNLGVAIGYAGGRRSAQGQIYRVQPKANLKTFDLEAPINTEQNVDLVTDLHDTVREYLIKHDQDTGFVTGNVELVDSIFEVEATGMAIFRNLFDSLFDGGPGTGSPEIGLLGQINNLMIDVFRKHGYEGFTHEGGNIVGNVKHNVTTAFDANDVKIMEKIKVEDLTPATTARHALITQRMTAARNKMKERMREVEEIDQRAAELRTIKLPENLGEDFTVPKQQQDELIALIAQMRDEYPSYDLSLDTGMAFWDPADGLIPGLRLERSLAQHMLFDYGPLSRISSFYDAVFGRVDSKRLSTMARTAVYDRMLNEGATTRQINHILSELNTRVREQTVGPLRVPWFRDITSLPAQQINGVAKRILDEQTWTRIEARYGREGFHRLLDESANEFIRRVDKNVLRGTENGKLARALREGYKLWTNTPAVGSVSRLVSKQFYHVFRFMLDLRWHFLNLIEADMLAIGRSGLDSTRFGSKPTKTGEHALQQHSNRTGIPMEFFTKMDSADGGPTSAFELFDVGLYLHNRNVLPVITKNFTKDRLSSVDKVLDELPTSSSVHRMLVERFGSDGRSWSKQLDDMMYDFDNKGVRQTVFDTAKKDGWTDAEIIEFGDVLERVTELNQRSYDDIVAVYTGDLHRSRIERVLNSYWLYWPISYQIKATKWMFNSLLNRFGGRRLNMLPLYKYNQVAEQYQELLMNNVQFQEEMEKNEDLWFAVNMLFPATPMDTGVSLNRGVRYVTSLVAPNVIPPYIGIDGPEDIPTRMLEMGPVFTARFLQSIVNESKENPNKRKVAGTPVEPGPIVRQAP